LKYVGIYGNSNPNFIKDWVEVQDETTTTSPPTFSGRTCTFSGAYNLRFYLTKLGTTSNPQYKISRIRLVPQRISWVHRIPDTTASQDFYAQLSVSFHETPQDDSEFIPKPPNRLPKLSRNVLYPFFIYDSAATFGQVFAVGLLAALFLVL
jgi:hypothetical protein